MQLLEERILKDGIVKPGNVLKVDSFLNHQMDIEFINELGKEFKRRFADAPITKILTIEASGIGCFRKESTEPESGRRDVYLQSRIFYTQESIRRYPFQKVPRTGRSCTSDR